MMDYSQKMKALLKGQLTHWQLAADNFDALKAVRLKTFQFDGFTVKVQFNPSRIVSSGAKLDADTIKKRKCFLCQENQPAEQDSLLFGSYSIQVNPFPIFGEHFTVKDQQHVPQSIDGRMADMLQIATATQGYTTFYNGPGCGASAPDHFHFQAGTNGVMPIDTEIDAMKLRYGKRVVREGVQVWKIADGMRNFILLESADKAALTRIFDKIVELLRSFSQLSEPLLNILAFADDETVKVIVFPREKQRPQQFYEEGDGHMMISPASVEMGGLLITPLEKDFEKITPNDIVSIMQQVSIESDKFDEIFDQL